MTATRVLACVFVGLTVARAAPRDESIVAAMRLSEVSGYAWRSTVTDDARSYEIRGATERGGYTRVRMPAINRVRRQLGLGVTDTQVEMIFAGNVACVIETDEGWRRPDELPAVPTTPRPPGTATGAVASLPIPGAPLPAGGRSPAPFSTLQLAISHPHEDLGVIVSSSEGWTVEGDRVRGTLTDTGARLLLVRDGQTALNPLRAGGEFTLSIRDGIVWQYRVALHGTLEVRTNAGRREIAVTQTTETVLTRIGQTRVSVPDEVRERLPLAERVTGVRGTDR